MCWDHVHGQRVGGGGTGQFIQLDPAAEIAGILDPPQRTRQRIKERQQQQQPVKQLIQMQTAIAVSGPASQTVQVSLQPGGL